METLLDILTGTHIGGIFALLQTILFVLILFTLAVLSWWLAIVITDLKKKLQRKTGARK